MWEKKESKGCFQNFMTKQLGEWVTENGEKMKEKNFERGLVKSDLVFDMLTLDSYPVYMK